MTVREGEPLLRSPRRFAHAAAAVVFLEGCLVLVGWWRDQPGLRSVLPGLVAMNPLTAIALLLAAVSVGLLLHGEHRRAPRVAGIACAVAVALVALVKSGSFFGWDAGIDQVLFPDKLAAYSPPNRMAPNTTLDFVLIGLALVLLDVETPTGRRPAQFLAVLTALTALFALLGYAYGVQALYAVISYIPMGLNTAVAFALLSAAIVWARPDKGLAAVAHSDTAGGAVVRRLLPPAIAVPAALGWLSLQGERAGLYDAALAIALIVAASIVTFAALIWRTGGLLARTEQARRRAEAERERLHRATEDARSQTRSVLDAVGEAVVFLSPDRRVGSVNRRCTELLGFTAAGVLGLRVDELRHDVRRLFVDPAALTPAGGGDGMGDGREGPAGTAELAFGRQAIEVFSAPVAGAEGAALGRIYAFRDVTAQREVERLKEERRRRLEEELARAAQVQADLLPRDVPTLPGFELAARCLPAREVGGDFFDWLEPAPGVLTLTLGDVMGKGMPAALLMATVRAALEAVARRNPPAVAVQTVAAALERDLDRVASFITLFHAEVDAAARRVAYVDAGHGHALLRREGGRVEELGPHGVPLGVLPDPVYQQGEVTLAPGDALVVYSDGLLDARPELGLTPADLAAALEGAPDAPAMVERLVALASPVGPLPDDMTVIVLRCREAAGVEQGAGDAA